MLDPYRTPVLVAVEPLPDACLPDGAASRCPYCAPPVAMLAPRASRRISPAFAKALSAAATLLLLVGSASLSAITWTVVSYQSSRVHPSEPPAQSRLPQLPALGGETHDVEALWTDLARADSGRTLVRATLAPGALDEAAGHARVRYEAREGGLRIVGLDGREPAALIGLRAGDLIIAVNGVRLRHPEDLLHAYSRIASPRPTKMVVELVRDGKPVALRIDWRS